MKTGDLVCIESAVDSRYGLLLGLVGWRDVLEYQIKTRRAWWVHFPDKDEAIAYDEDLIILLSEDDGEKI